MTDERVVMEFDNVGLHCEYENCNQKDFLPFKCSKCYMNLCFIHRSEFAHNCVNKNINDMTSLDCPVCKKSFKLTKSEDPNDAWDRHFSTECSQQPEKGKLSTIRCASPICKTVLGPSNRFQCPQCKTFVCLSCRTPDAHKCTSLRNGSKRTRNTVAAARAKKFGGGNNNAKSSSATSHSSNKNITSSGGSRRPENNENTLKGSAQRRMNQRDGQLQDSALTAAQGNVTTEFHDCPLCSKSFQNSTELVHHVDRDHDMTQPSSINNNNTAPLGQLQQSDVNSTEVCPTCSQRFPDVMSLIHHAEQYHSGIVERTTSDNKCLLS